MELSGQIALVTGASRGIGRAIAARLVEQGAKVIGTATGDSGVMPLEITNQDSIEQHISKINSQWGEVSILVNNAGVCQDNLLLRLSLEAWEQVLSVNLTGVFRLTKAVLGSMVKRRYGRIINIGSVVGSSGNAGQTNYAAAKAGLIGYSKSLAQEVARRGITVNVVSPGFIDTDMAQALSEARQQQIVSQIPLGRLGTAEEVAYLVAFLASPQAAYITGETIQVNGGLHMV